MVVRNLLIPLDLGKIVSQPLRHLIYIPKKNDSPKKEVKPLYIGA
jgi:hypothetical protein